MCAHNADRFLREQLDSFAAQTLEQIQHVLARMPTDTDIEKCDHALVAFAILSGPGTMPSRQFR